MHYSWHYCMNIMADNGWVLYIQWVEVLYSSCSIEWKLFCLVLYMHYGRCWPSVSEFENLTLKCQHKSTLACFNGCELIHFGSLQSVLYKCTRTDMISGFYKNVPE